MPEKPRFTVWAWRTKGWFHLGADLRIYPWPSLTVYLVLCGFEVGWV